MHCRVDDSLRWAVAGSIALAVACGGAEGAGSGARAKVRDSAGVQLVENTGPAWPEGAGWTVVDSPTVDIGGVAGDPAYDLSQVIGVVRLSDGRLAVAVGGAFQVRYYDPAGVHLASSGTKGNGPGEYQGMGGIWLLRGDSVMVSDLLVRRLTVLDGSGKLSRAFSLGGETGFNMPSQGGQMSFALPLGTFRDGSVLGQRQSFSLNDQRKGAYRDSVTYIVYHPDGTAGDTLGRIPGMEMEQIAMTFGPQSFSAPSPVPLGKNTIVTVAGDAIVLAKNNGWELEIRDGSGAVKRLIRVRQSPRRIAPEHVTAHRAWTRQQMEDQPMMRGVPEPIKKQITDRIDKASYPELFPYIEAILPATDGTLWVQEQGNPGEDRRTFAVVDSTGQLLGRVQMPHRFRPTFVNGDLVAGVWQDPDDVEHVRVYRVKRTED